MVSIPARLKNISRTPTQWAADDRVLLKGEIGIIDNSPSAATFKIGDGVTAFSALPVVSGGSGGGSVDLSPYAKITDMNTALAGKQPTLVSGTNIKTVNGVSILGSGDLAVTGSGTVDLTPYAKTADVNSALDTKADASATSAALAGKQATLVSGTNIKTVNGSSILGGGDLAIAGGAVNVQEGALTASLTEAPNASGVIDAIADAVAGVTAGSTAPVATAFATAIPLDKVQVREMGKVHLDADTVLTIAGGAVDNGSCNLTVGGNFNLDLSAFQNGNGYAYSKTNWNNLVFVQRPDAAYVFGVKGGTYTAPVVYVTSDNFDQADGPLKAGWATHGGAVIGVVGNKAVVPGSGSIGSAWMICDTGRASGTVTCDLNGAQYPTLICRYQDDNNYLGVQLGKADHSVEVYKIEGGVQAELYHSGADLYAGGVQALKVVTEANNTISVYLAGALLYSFVSTFLAGNTLRGFRFFDGGDSVDNFNTTTTMDYPVDSTAPTITAAAVDTANPNRVNLTFSEAINSDIPSKQVFRVVDPSGNGGLGVEKTVTGHTYVDGTHTYITVTEAFVAGENSFSLMYTAANDATHKLRDLAGNLLADIAGRTITNALTAITTLMDDNFNRADSNLPGSTSSGGQTWGTYLPPDSSAARIVGNSATGHTSLNYAYAMIDIGMSTGYRISADLTPNQCDTMLIFQHEDAINKEMRVNFSKYGFGTLYEGLVNIGGSSGWTADGTVTYHLDVDVKADNTIDVYVNGTKKISASSTLYAANTKVGFRFDVDSGIRGVIDNFKVVTL